MVAAWLTTDQLIRNFTVVVDNILTGRTPSGHLGKVRPTGNFQVREDRNGLAIDPRSYARYDKYADAISGLDARGGARLYATLKPRIQDAYRELGHPDGDVDPAVERALVELLKTPVIDGDVALASRTVAYEFADPRLQSLSSAERSFSAWVRGTSASCRRSSEKSPRSSGFRQNHYRDNPRGVFGMTTGRGRCLAPFRKGASHLWSDCSDVNCG